MIKIHHMNMTILKSLYVATLTAGTFTILSGCSLLNNNKKYVVTGSGQELSQTDNTETLRPLSPPKQQADKEKKKTQKKSKSNSNSRTQVTSGETADGSYVASNSAQTATRQNTALPTDFTINGEWTIYSVRNNVVTGEERPYITFDLAANRFYGSNGCNIINGDAIVSDKNALKLDNIITTMKMCGDAPFEYLINLALSEVVSYNARQVGPNTFLDLKGSGNSTIMVLRRHNMDFLNGAWAITSLNGTAMPAEGAEDAATMTINIPDLQIHGTTGCNIFNGKLFIDPDKNNSMQFENIGMTRMACPPDSRETEFLLGLEMVETAKSTGKDTIAMYSADGELIFEMRRIHYDTEE